MELIHGYGWILSAVIIIGWVISWWTRRWWSRWTVVFSGIVASLLCIAYGLTDYGQPISQPEHPCSHVVECLNQHPVGWLTNGMVGFACSFALMLVTSVADFVIAHGPRASAE